MSQWFRNLLQERRRIAAIRAASAGFDYCAAQWHEAQAKWQTAVANGDIDAQRVALAEQQEWQVAERWWHEELKKL